MALPAFDMPTYTVEIPSTGNTVRYRPFVVKEEKALLLAQQSDDPITMIETLKNVIRGCVQDEVDVEKLATFDLEYLFTNIRAKSVGETVDLYVKCGEESCKDNKKASVKMTFDITELKVEHNPDHTNKIELFGDVGVVMKYPNIQTLKKLKDLNPESGEVDIMFSIIADCIEYIFQGEDIYYANEQTREELEAFVGNLTSEQFIKVQSFLTTMPKLTKELHFKCPECGTEATRKLEGITSFF